MPLYLVQHHHSDENCPRKNLDMVRQLGGHMNQATADRFGVKILADWVDDSEHSVVLVLEADSADKAESFVAPFQKVGSVSVKPGITCEQMARACLGGQPL